MKLFSRNRCLRRHREFTHILSGLGETFSTLNVDAFILSISERLKCMSDMFEYTMHHRKQTTINKT